MEGPVALDDTQRPYHYNYDFLPVVDAVISTHRYRERGIKCAGCRRLYASEKGTSSVLGLGPGACVPNARKFKTDMQMI